MFDASGDHGISVIADGKRHIQMKRAQNSAPATERAAVSEHPGPSPGCG